MQNLNQMLEGNYPNTTQKSDSIKTDQIESLMTKRDELGLNSSEYDVLGELLSSELGGDFKYRKGWFFNDATRVNIAEKMYANRKMRTLFDRAYLSGDIDSTKKLHELYRLVNEPSTSDKSSLKSSKILNRIVLDSDRMPLNIALNNVRLGEMYETKSNISSATEQELKEIGREIESIFAPREDNSDILDQFNAMGAGFAKGVATIPLNLVHGITNLGAWGLYEKGFISRKTQNSVDDFFNNAMGLLAVKGGNAERTETFFKNTGTVTLAAFPALTGLQAGFALNGARGLLSATMSEGTHLATLGGMQTLFRGATNKIGDDLNVDPLTRKNLEFIADAGALYGYRQLLKKSRAKVSPKKEDTKINLGDSDTTIVDKSSDMQPHEKALVKIIKKFDPNEQVYNADTGVWEAYGNNLAKFKEASQKQAGTPQDSYRARWASANGNIFTPDGTSDYIDSVNGKGRIEPAISPMNTELIVDNSIRDLVNRRNEATPTSYKYISNKLQDLISTELEKTPQSASLIRLAKNNPELAIPFVEDVGVADTMGAIVQYLQRESPQSINPILSKTIDASTKTAIESLGISSFIQDGFDTGDLNIKDLENSAIHFRDFIKTGQSMKMKELYAPYNYKLDAYAQGNPELISDTLFNISSNWQEIRDNPAYTGALEKMFSRRGVSIVNNALSGEPINSLNNLVRGLDSQGNSIPVYRAVQNIRSLLSTADGMEQFGFKQANNIAKSAFANPDISQRATIADKLIKESNRLLSLIEKESLGEEEAKKYNFIAQRAYAKSMSETDRKNYDIIINSRDPSRVLSLLEQLDGSMYPLMLETIKDMQISEIVKNMRDRGFIGEKLTQAGLSISNPPNLFSSMSIMNRLAPALSSRNPLRSIAQSFRGVSQTFNKTKRFIKNMKSDSQVKAYDQSVDILDDLAKRLSAKLDIEQAIELVIKNKGFTENAKTLAKFALNTFFKKGKGVAKLINKLREENLSKEEKARIIAETQEILEIVKFNNRDYLNAYLKNKAFDTYREK